MLNHPAVVNHGRGVSSEDLASFVEAISSLAQSRVMGVGHEQYATGRLQRFERLSPEATVAELLDELADVVVYATMGAIKTLALLRRMRGVEE